MLPEQTTGRWEREQAEQGRGPPSKEVGSGEVTGSA